MRLPYETITTSAAIACTSPSSDRESMGARAAGGKRTTPCAARMPVHPASSSSRTTSECLFPTATFMANSRLCRAAVFGAHNAAHVHLGIERADEAQSRSQPGGWAAHRRRPQMLVGADSCEQRRDAGCMAIARSFDERHALRPSLRVGAGGEQKPDAICVTLARRRNQRCTNAVIKPEPRFRPCHLRAQASRQTSTQQCLNLKPHNASRINGE